MKRKQIPAPMQAQILIQTALAILSLTVGVSLFCCFTSAMALPFLFLTILAAANGCRVYRISAKGCYLTLSGTVLSVERTAILRRPKALLAEIEGKTLRIVLRNRHKAPEKGGRIVIYVQDSTPIYEWKNTYLLNSYMAVETAKIEMPAKQRNRVN